MPCGRPQGAWHVDVDIKVSVRAQYQYAYQQQQYQQQQYPFVNTQQYQQQHVQYQAQVQYRQQHAQYQAQVQQYEQQQYQQQQQERAAWASARAAEDVETSFEVPIAWHERRQEEVLRHLLAGSVEPWAWPRLVSFRAPPRVDAARVAGFYYAGGRKIYRV